MDMLKSASLNTTVDPVHIGRCIKARMNCVGLTASWLARHLACDRTNIYKLFNRQSVDSSTLMRISLALHYDFFALYTQAYQDEARI